MCRHEGVSMDSAALPSIAVQSPFQVDTEGKQRGASLRGRQADLRGCQGFQLALGPTGEGLEPRSRLRSTRWQKSRDGVGPWLQDSGPICRGRTVKKQWC